MESLRENKNEDSAVIIVNENNKIIFKYNFTNEIHPFLIANAFINGIDASFGNFITYSKKLPSGHKIIFVTMDYVKLKYTNNILEVIEESLIKQLFDPEINDNISLNEEIILKNILTRMLNIQ